MLAVGTLEQFVGRGRIAAAPPDRFSGGTPPTAPADAVSSRKPTFKQIPDKALAALARRDIDSRAPAFAGMLAAMQTDSDPGAAFIREMRTINVAKTRLVVQDEKGRQSVVEFRYGGKLLARHYGRMLNEPAAGAEAVAMSASGQATMPSTSADPVEPDYDFMSEDEALDALGQTLALESETDAVESMENESFDAWKSVAGLVSFRPGITPLIGTAPGIFVCASRTSVMLVSAENCMDKHVAAGMALLGLRYEYSNLKSLLQTGLSQITQLGTYRQTYVRVVAFNAEVVGVAAFGFLVGYTVGSALDCYFGWSLPAFAPEAKRRALRGLFGTRAGFESFQARRTWTATIVNEFPASAVSAGLRLAPLA